MQGQHVSNLAALAEREGKICGIYACIRVYILYLCCTLFSHPAISLVYIAFFLCKEQCNAIDAFVELSAAPLAYISAISPNQIGMTLAGGSSER